MGKVCFMTEFNASMDKMKTDLKNISDLLKSGTMALNDITGENPWNLQPVFENDYCSMGIVTIKTDKAIPCEAHIHENSNEYLVVTKGRLLLHINNKAVRVLEEGECASVPKGTLHFSQPLTPDTELAYICVPKDKKIPTPVEHKD